MYGLIPDYRSGTQVLKPTMEIPELVEPGIIMITQEPGALEQAGSVGIVSGKGKKHTGAGIPGELSDYVTSIVVNVKTIAVGIMQFSANREVVVFLTFTQWQSRRLTGTARVDGGVNEPGRAGFGHQVLFADGITNTDIKLDPVHIGTQKASILLQSFPGWLFGPEILHWQRGAN
tara:strand:- start:8560 stop:9084 length:525 start_codon:yes stop_codon:yes gene_type:complete